MSILQPVTAAEFYNTRIKHFPTFDKIVCFNRPIFNPMGLVPMDDEKHVIADSDTNTERATTDDGIRLDSLRRARESAYEIAFANNFQYFVTFTLNRQMIDRYESKIIYPKLKNFLSNMVSRHDAKYLLCAEYHKQKEDEDKPAIHFHGLMSANFKLRDKGLVTKRGQTVYQIMNWKYGFSSAVLIDDNYQRTCNYVMKYITKENRKIFGKFYFSGGDISRKVPTEYDNVDYSVVPAPSFPVFGHLAVKYVEVQNDS